jgi:LCP family protein required for cell wall assembly
MTRPVRHKSHFWKRIGNTLGVLACLFFLTLGTVFGHFYWGSKTFHDAFLRDPMGIFKGMAQGDPLQNWTIEKQFPGRSSLIILVLGVDYDYDNRAQIIKTANGRSDAILLTRVDFLNQTINAITIPRDAAVRIPGRETIHKINAAHSYGGPELTLETIRSVFGITPDAYVTVDFKGFQKIVDAVGGVEINVEKRLKYDDNWGNLHIDLHPGLQRLNGYQAMGYVRMRHSDSDEMRSKRQHAFLEAMRRSIMSPSNFLKLPQVLDRLNENIRRGALTEDQLFALANYARTLPKERIRVQTIPYDEGPSYAAIDADKTADLIREMFYPGQYVRVTVDVPGFDVVRSLNSRYERRRSRRASVEDRRDDRSEEQMLEKPENGGDPGTMTDEADGGPGQDTQPPTPDPGRGDNGGGSDSGGSGDSSDNPGNTSESSPQTHREQKRETHSEIAPPQETNPPSGRPG